jgi:hypothetical protein
VEEGCGEREQQEEIKVMVVVRKMEVKEEDDMRMENDDAPVCSRVRVDGNIELMRKEGVPT